MGVGDDDLGADAVRATHRPNEVHLVALGCEAAAGEQVVVLVRRKCVVSSLNAYAETPSILSTASLTGLPCTGAAAMAPGQ